MPGSSRRPGPNARPGPRPERQPPRRQRLPRPAPASPAQTPRPGPARPGPGSSPGPQPGPPSPPARPGPKPRRNSRIMAICGRPGRPGGAGCRCRRGAAKRCAIMNINLMPAAPERKPAMRWPGDITCAMAAAARSQLRTNMYSQARNCPESGACVAVAANGQCRNGGGLPVKKNMNKLALPEIIMVAMAYGVNVY